MPIEARNNSRSSAILSLGNHSSGNFANESCTAVSLGFSTNRVMRRSSLICMIPNDCESRRDTGIVAMVMSALLSACCEIIS